MKYEEKVYLNEEQLISKLKDDGLIIEKVKYVKKYLRNVGYYKLINGYKHPFKYKDSNKFKTGTTFNEITSLYKFDFNLRHLLFKYICIIENSLKSDMAEIISKTFGTKDEDYLKAENFREDNIKYKNKNFEDIKKEIYQKIEANKLVQNSIETYSQKGYYPFWVLANILSFGTIGLLYNKLKPTEQKFIANRYNISIKAMGSLINNLVLFRNAFAHNEIAFNFKTRNRLKQDKTISVLYTKLHISKNQYGIYLVGTRDLLSLSIIFKILLEKNLFTKFTSEFYNLLNYLSKNINKESFEYILNCMGIKNNVNYIKELEKIKKIFL